MTFDASTPVLLLSGRESCVAVARNLGRVGVPVFVSGAADCPALRSRYCRSPLFVPPGRTGTDYWKEILLADPLPELAGAVILPFCDESLAFTVANRDALKLRYRIEDMVPELRRAALDKLDTLSLARAAGVPTPKAWPVGPTDDVRALREEIRLPVMVKPRDSLSFSREFGAKLFIIQDSFDEVVEKVALCRSRGHEIMIIEMIPGPDDLLSSYYTYRTPEGERLYDYTKSIIRRWPVNRGGACYHQSEWLPETAEMGRRLFEGIGWQGIGNVEFKRDTRDGQLKIIEINARVTAAHRLVTESGAPIDLIIYCHLTGQPVPQFDWYSHRIRMWYPIRDFLAYRELSKAGKLGFLQWLRSLLGQKLVLPFMSFDDPRPALFELRQILRHAISTPRAGQRGRRSAVPLMEPVPGAAVHTLK